MLWSVRCVCIRCDRIDRRQRCSCTGRLTLEAIRNAQARTTQLSTVRTRLFFDSVIGAAAGAICDRCVSGCGPP
eukprot:14731620-Alexandrium_andersonii.AAC.1